jgi:hypothetical protein
MSGPTLHLSWDEVKCKCGCGLGTHTEDFEPVLLERFEQMRYYYGRPIQVTSCARCAAHNRAQGGSPTSSHVPSEDDRRATLVAAIDVACSNPSDRFDLIHSAIAGGYRRIIVEPGCLHLDVHPGKPSPWFAWWQKGSDG